MIYFTLYCVGTSRTWTRTSYKDEHKSWDTHYHTPRQLSKPGGTNFSFNLYNFYISFIILMHSVQNVHVHDIKWLVVVAIYNDHIKLTNRCLSCCLPQTPSN